MIDSHKLKECVSWPLIRAHLCTTAVALGFHSTWRLPREAYRYGGMQYGLAVTAAMLSVALPLALLQLAVGQLSQQDAVGIWRAVPFFRGIGYMRVLISFLGAVYSMIYLAMAITYFLYTITNSLPFWECIEVVLTQEDYVNSVNASSCLEDTFMAPVAERPEYYLAVASIIVVLWIVFPFIFYNPVKLMKRIFYVLGPVVIVLAVVIVSCIGDWANLLTFLDKKDWKSFLEPYIWHGAIAQALLSCQIAGGYLISAGDSVYSSTNVQWTALAFVGANILSTWVGLLFWFSISGPDKDTSVFAPLVQAYQLGEEASTDLAWPLTIFLMLIISGFITLLSLLYPVYDRFRRIGGVKWRLVSFSGSLAGAAISLAALAGRMPALNLLEDYTIPFLISFATVTEILAFVFIYGWKVLVEDVEFLTGREVPKFWVLGWCASPGIIAPFTVWWLTMVYIREVQWLQPPWAALTTTTTAVVTFFVFIVFAAIAVVKQVQYDIIGKLKSSFQPSRHWGPRDPITHYYWLARRNELERGTVLRSRYHRRQLGQLSGQPSFLNLSSSVQENNDETISAGKIRSNSDDWLYSVYRKQITCFQEHMFNRRSKSLDWTFPNMTGRLNGATELKKSEIGSTIEESIASQENNSDFPVVQKIDFKIEL